MTTNVDRTGRSDAASVEPVATATVTWAMLADVVAIVVFVAIGRSSHAEGETLAGLWSTAWPFLCGLAIIWVVAGVWRRPTSLVPAALSVWLGTVAVGMTLRVVVGQGTAVAFVFVALGFLGATLGGWRLMVLAISRYRR